MLSIYLADYKVKIAESWESIIKYAKMLNMCAKRWESVANVEKVWENMPKAEKVLESVPKAGKVLESVPKADKVCQNWVSMRKSW